MEDTLQLPMIHLNGTGADSLFKQYNEAYDAVCKAVDAFDKIDCNARDYYVIDSEAHERARKHRSQQKVKLMNVQFYLEHHLVHIEKYK